MIENHTRRHDDADAALLDMRYEDSEPDGKGMDLSEFLRVVARGSSQVEPQLRPIVASRTWRLEL